jgi:hypothetical protein
VLIAAPSQVVAEQMIDTETIIAEKLVSTTIVLATFICDDG